MKPWLLLYTQRSMGYWIDILISHKHTFVLLLIWLIDFMESCSRAICFWGNVVLDSHLTDGSINKALRPAEQNWMAVSLCVVLVFNATLFLWISQWKKWKTNGNTGDAKPTSGELRQMSGWKDLSITSETLWMPKLNSLQLVHRREPGGGSCIMLIYLACSSRRCSWDTSHLCVITISLVVAAPGKDNPSL